MMVYTGKSDRVEQALSHHFTVGSPRSCSTRGYNLFIDNYYTSPQLLRELWEDTPACGTVRSNRVGVPKLIVCKKNKSLEQERGSSVHRQSGPLYAYAWRDKRIVTLLSTLPDGYDVVTIVVKENGRWVKKDIPCPSAVVKYTKYIGGVDLADQYMGYYSFVKRRFKKWVNKAVFDLLDAAMLKFNPYLLFKETPRRIWIQTLVQKKTHLAPQTIPYAYIILHVYVFIVK